MVRIRLSRIMGEQRLTQADLARMTNIRPATINEIYHEFCTRISIEHIDKICGALGCGVADLLEYTPDGNPISNEKGLRKG